MKTTTVINHELRKTMRLSCNEYCVCDYFFTETTITRQELADLLGVSKQALIAIIKRLIADGYLQKDQNKKLHCTEKWEKSFDFFESKETLPKKPTFNIWQPASPLRKKSIV